MADRQEGWRTSDRKRCHHSPRRRSLLPELSLCPRPPLFRFLSSGVPALCPALCGSVELWKSEWKTRETRSTEPTD